LNSRIRYRHITLFTEERMRQSRSEHLEILKHMRERNAGKAAQAIRKHIAAGMRIALKMFTLPMGLKAVPNSPG
jgi:DNA-binding GntR family transcriptional regulator